MKVLFGVLLAAALSCAAQQAPQGSVIYSRSTSQNGQTVTQADQSVGAAVQMVSAPLVEDPDRDAVRFTDFDMDVHLRLGAEQIAVRCLVVVKNTGKNPLPRIPLQISSSLNWERIRVNGRDIRFPVATLNSDSDHTGQLHEAEVPLAVPLLPGQSIQFDVAYGGAIAPSAQRLIAIGTPSQVALHSDWDGIGVSFTGLRGFGNVVWYPVSAVPVILGDGARLFNQIGEQKLRMAGAHFRLRLTAEFPHDRAPSIVLVNGHPASFNVTDSPGAGFEVPGIVNADSGSTTLGFEAPSLFLASRNPHAATNTTLWTLSEDDIAASDWAAATAAVTPFLQGWLGQRPRAQLTVLDLPDPEDAPYETGALLATSIRQANAQQLDGILAHALTHAWMLSPRAWLSEGVAHFMGTLWIEKQRGKEQALENLEASRPALALAEPASPGQSAGEPLDRAISPIYFRTKAAYVLWMLRDVAGEASLSAALRAYDPSQDYGPDSSSFERLLEQAGQRRDLHWFFADWVDADKGLPDLSIQNAFSASTGVNEWLVSVTVGNAGYASAEVPVTVRSATNAVTQRVIVPARGQVVQRIQIQSQPSEVQVNDGTVPETQASVHITRLQ